MAMPLVKRALGAAWAGLAVVVLSWPLAVEAQAKREPSAARLAARERQKQCSADWKAAKAGGKLAPGSKWPKFWSECNKRLKGGKD
jgi:hypothetical protein